MDREEVPWIMAWSAGTGRTGTTRTRRTRTRERDKDPGVVGGGAGGDDDGVKDEGRSICLPQWNWDVGRTSGKNVVRVSEATHDEEEEEEEDEEEDWLRAATLRNLPDGMSRRRPCRTSRPWS
jgi:hypothetical protein